MIAWASGPNFTDTSVPCNSKTPACAGPLGNTMALLGSVPNALSPGLSQNKPAKDSQFCLRLSTSSAFHFSYAWTYDASGVGADGFPPAAAITANNIAGSIRIKDLGLFIHKVPVNLRTLLFKLVQIGQWF